MYSTLGTTLYSRLQNEGFTEVTPNLYKDEFDYYCGVDKVNKTLLYYNEKFKVHRKVKFKELG